VINFAQIWYRVRSPDSRYTKTLKVKGLEINRASALADASLPYRYTYRVRGKGHGMT